MIRSRGDRLRDGAMARRQVQVVTCDLIPIAAMAISCIIIGLLIAVLVVLVRAKP